MDEIEFGARRKSPGLLAYRDEPVTVAVEGGLAAEARALGIDVADACLRGLVAEIARKRRQGWQIEPRAASSAFPDTWRGIITPPSSSR